MEPVGKGKAKLAVAFGRILERPLSSSSKRPILASQRGIEKSLDDEKKHEKARKALAADKKARSDLQRHRPEVLSTDVEKKLRKVATRGVVKLFNAIRVAQKTVDTVKSEGVKKVPAAAAATSFMSMIKS
ncbi:hypothetical protein HK101_002926 [Irineochytrium annulatum]|nr:hypothetical protein HK101_002926 [Irineochytrium annulatum]